MDADAIIKQITMQLQRWGVGYANVCVGHTNDAERARREHVIVGEKDLARFVIFTAASAKDARTVVATMAKRHCDGPAAVLMADMRLVYVFVKSPTTLPSSR